MSVYAEFRAPTAAYPLGEPLADHPEVTVEVDRILHAGAPTHYVWIAGPGRETFLATLRADPPGSGVRTVEDVGNRTLVVVEWQGHPTPLFAAVAAAERQVAGLRGGHEGWRLRLRLPDQRALATFREECAGRGISLTLEAVYGPAVADGSSEDDLTEPQAETIAAAFAAGYFDVPRRVTLADLAADLGVSEQAVSERLRRALATILGKTLAADSAGRGAESDGDG